MISLIGQVLLVFGMSGATFWWLPPEIYLLVALIIMLLAAGLMYQVEAGGGDQLELTLGFVLTLLMVSVLFGAFWPALPVIVVVGGVKRRRAEQQARDEKDSQRLSPREGP